MMTVIVTRMPGNITQLFNTDTGRITYKCRSDSAYLLLDAFGGIVKFNKKGATATVAGHITELDFCDVLKKGHVDYQIALESIVKSHVEFAQQTSDKQQDFIHELEHKLSGL